MHNRPAWIPCIAKQVKLWESARLPEGQSQARKQILRRPWQSKLPAADCNSQVIGAQSHAPEASAGCAESESAGGPQDWALCRSL